MLRTDWRTLILPALVAVLCALFLTTVLRTPLLGDDAFNSYLTGYTGYESIGLAQFFIRYNQWILDQIGRFFPGEIALQVLEFGLTQSAITVKIMQCALITANVVTFWYFVRALRGSLATATLAAVIALMTMQLRVFHDPIIGPSLTLQLVLEFFLLSALCALRFFADGKVAWLTTSAVLFIVNATLYEISYLYLVVMIFISLLTPLRQRGLVTIAVHVTIFAAFVALDLILRSGHPIAANSEYHIHFDPSLSPTTLYYQVIAAFPLVYLHVNHDHIFDTWPALLINGSGLAFVIAAAAFAIVYTALKERLRSERETDAVAAPLLVVGLLLAIVPALPLSLSPLWQKTLYFGVAFLPVYLSGFGIALLLALCVSWFAISFKRSGLRNGAVAALIGLVMCLVLTLTYRANGVVAHEFDGGWRYPRESLGHALESGLLAGVPKNATLVFDRSYPFFYGPPAPFFWPEKYVVYFYTHRRFNVLSADDAVLGGPLCRRPLHAGVCRLPANVWLLHNSATADVWDVSLVHALELAGGADPSRPSALTDDIRVFHRGPGGLDSAAYPSALGATIQVEHGADGTLSEIRPTCTPADAGALLAKMPFRITFGAGGYGEEPLVTGGSFHWMRSHATLVIANQTGLEQSAQLRTVFAAFGGRRPWVSVAVGSERRVFPTDARTVREIPFALAPDSAITLQLDSSAPRVAAPTDPRDMHYQMRNVSVVSTGQRCMVNAVRVRL